MAAHYLIEISKDLGAAGQLVKTRIVPDQILRARAERHRVHAINYRRLMQGDEWVRVVPVAAGRDFAIDNCQVRIGFREQRIGERQPDGACPYDQVIGFSRQRPSLRGSQSVVVEPIRFRTGAE